jgi:hypothetical protein
LDSIEIKNQNAVTGVHSNDEALPGLVISAAKAGVNIFVLPFTKPVPSFEINNTAHCSEDAKTQSSFIRLSR